ncbi:MAG TPA: DNA-deoxyinosine glycosylase [Victivallales bacterium]|nr:DNA-deoxyinosine glycosylase [Victivallales bacterium]
MNKLKGFNLVADLDAEILILGSMPSVESLKYQQYYAHTRNLFWHFMGKILDFTSDISYEKKIDYLTKSKIALWDVVHKCHRKGSLDSKIKLVEVNDFGNFFSKYNSIRAICFNGRKAEELFNKYVKKKLLIDHIKYYPMPSTSPANASINFETKFKYWLILKTIITK